MNNRTHYGRKILTLALTAALAASSFGVIASAVNSGSDNTQGYELAENIQEGTILHCFDWKYSDIKDELENIAKAGFTSIQTSPAQEGAGEGTWFWLYQPLGFSVQTNGLGTKEELKELCDEAEKYGINVIVDVVANHLAGNHDNIQADLKAEEYWHTYGNVTNYNNRTEVTQGDIGMQDLNSENEYVQKVVAGYIDELKELGVDGIRWDAAKHIALPSEDCNFWPAVTASGLYNYGEILDSPGGSNADDLMAEYTKYMSVTDDGYSNSLLSSFRSGKAPAIDANWTDRGVSADKLVFWGESHDTYSNAEGEGSNGSTQNEVDRAYAVAAARNDSTALYFSRPSATARDSIRIGDKGSLHFTSPEIAAVNHFHNAMVGKEDRYAVTDNNAVVTRKDGGAVIVCGSGSGTVTVANAGSYAKPGTYKDEVTGNEFVVTADTITGTVGSSGIAVIYDSDFVSRVEASVETGTTFKTDTLQVTLRAIDVTDAAYTTSEGFASTYQDGDVIEIGSASASGETITLTLTGINADGKSVSATYKYTKDAGKTYPTLESGGVVFDNSKTNWTSVNVYVYDESGAEIVTNGDWPGVAMVDCGDNLYKYELPEQFADCSHIMVIFNNGSGDQIPAAMAAGLTMAYTDKKLYDGTNWLDLEVADDPTDEPTDEDSDPENIDDPTDDEDSDPEYTDDPTDDEDGDTTDDPADDDNQGSTVDAIPSGSGSSDNSGSNTGSGSDNQASDVVNTSDSTSVTGLLLILAASALAGGAAFIRRKRSDEQ